MNARLQNVNVRTLLLSAVLDLRLQVSEGVDRRGSGYKVIFGEEEVNGT